MDEVTPDATVSEKTIEAVVSTGIAEQPKTAEPQKPEPSFEDKVREEVKKVVDATWKQLQSEHDRELAQERRKARAERMGREVAEQKLTEYDPDAVKDLELTRLRAQVQGTPEDQESAKAVEFLKEFLEPHLEDCKDMGIEPTDKRIDWAEDAPTLFQRNKRIRTSLRTIEKEERVKQREKGKTEAEEERRKTEANSVKTTGVAGTGTGTDADFLRKWGNGDIPSTKENMKRALKLQDI